MSKKKLFCIPEQAERNNHKKNANVKVLHHVRDKKRPCETQQQNQRFVAAKLKKQSFKSRKL